MNLEQKTLRLGTLVILLAVVLRLVGMGIPEKLARLLTQPDAISTVLFLQTGRVVRPRMEDTSQSPQVTVPAQTTPPTENIGNDQTTQPAPPEEQLTYAEFAPEDASLVAVNNASGYTVDTKALLTTPLSWDLTQDGPAVLIVHTHGTESYEKTEDYKETSAYRTTDTDYNVVSIGAHLKQVLEAGGIQVLHDPTMHDYPNYSGSYSDSRKTIQTYLKKYPSIRMVLDIHRDSVEGSDGKQKRYTLQTAEGTAAQVMLVVGTNGTGLSHPDWKENLSLAVKLHAQLEKEDPGICRPISFRAQRFNQDLTDGSLLLEMGSAGNTRQEALLSAELVGKAILALAHGTDSLAPPA